MSAYPTVFTYRRQNPTTHYDDIMDACYRRGRDACTSFAALENKPRNPYKRVDFALAWDCGYDDAYVNIMRAIEILEASDQEAQS